MCPKYTKRSKAILDMKPLKNIFEKITHLRTWVQASTGNISNSNISNILEWFGLHNKKPEQEGEENV